MDKADKFLKTLTDQVNFPSLETIYTPSSEQGYIAECSRGKITLRAKNSPELIQGVCQSYSLWKSGFISELNQKHTPIFTLRPFCLEKSPLIIEFLDAAAPDIQNRIDVLCENILALGCNALWVSDWDKEQLQLPEEVLQRLSITSQDYGLSFGSARNNEIVMDHVIHFAKEWETPLSRELNDRGISKLDSILEDAEQRASDLKPKQKLVLVYPKIHSEISFWEKLLAKLPPQCLIGFLCQDAAAFLKLCRGLGERYRGMLIPIIPTAGCGGGLWPHLYVEGIDEIFSSPLLPVWHTIAFSGTYLPPQGTLYHCLLWSLAQRVWKPGHSLSQWVRQWFSTYNPSLDFDQMYPHLMALTALSYDVKSFYGAGQQADYDKQKSFIEMSLSKIKYLNTIPWPAEVSSAVCHCLTDLRRMLLQHLLNGQISLPQIVDEQDLKGGYWTTMHGSPGQAVRSGVTIRFLDIPQNYSKEDVHWWNSSIFLS
ncbi:MAG: hypothetical protein WC222_01085 [Parachlamydiales bacterium]|jgi:hypothetical protein